MAKDQRILAAEIAAAHILSCLPFNDEESLMKLLTFGYLCKLAAEYPNWFHRARFAKTAKSRKRNIVRIMTELIEFIESN